MSINTPEELAILIDYTRLRTKYEQALMGNIDNQLLGASFYKKLLDQAVANHKDLLDDEHIFPYARVLNNKIFYSSENAEVELLKKRVAALEESDHKLLFDSTDINVAREHYYDLLETANADSMVEATLSVSVGYDGYVSRHELAAILEHLDGLVEQESLRLYNAETPDPALKDAIAQIVSSQPGRTFIGICSIDRGSIIIQLCTNPDFLNHLLDGAAYAVGNYAAAQLLEGVAESKLSEELKRLGFFIGTAMANIVKEFNDDMAKRYLLESSKQPSKIRGVTASRKSRKSQRE